MSRTKAHKTSQYATVSIEQHNAIDLLILGHTDHAVAEQIGVARETICRWRNENPYFMAELNRRRKAVWQTAHERIRGLVGKAIDIVEKALNADDVKAAFTVLKAANLYGHVEAPKGGTEPELVLLAQAEAWAAQELRRQGTSGDPLGMLLAAAAKPPLIRQRMEVLRRTYRMETGNETPQDQDTTRGR
jgi:hypothetical protein